MLFTVQPAHRSPQKPDCKDGDLLSLPFFKKEKGWVPHTPVVFVLGVGAEVEGHPHPWLHVSMRQRQKYVKICRDDSASKNACRNSLMAGVRSPDST